MGSWVVLEALAAEDRQRVLAAATRRRFGRRQALFHQDDPADTVHLIDQGRVAVQITTPLGDVATIAVAGPGEVVGELALLGSHPRRTASAVALEPTQTLAVHKSAFDELRRLHPSVNELLIEMLASTIRRTTTRLVDALYVPVDKRVAKSLCELADRSPPCDAAVLPMTQDELASMVGATRPTVNQALQKLQAAGAVRIARGTVEVIDRPTLGQLAI